LIRQAIILDDLFFLEGKCNSTLCFGHELSPEVELRKIITNGLRRRGNLLRFNTLHIDQDVIT
jgi:hypothetical protein